MEQVAELDLLVLLLRRRRRRGAGEVRRGTLLVQRAELVGPLQVGLDEQLDLLPVERGVLDQDDLLLAVDHLLLGAVVPEQAVSHDARPQGRVVVERLHGCGLCHVISSDQVVPSPVIFRTA